MRSLNALWLLFMSACFACAVIQTSGRGDFAKVRIGSSHVVDSNGDRWLVHGFDSDPRGLLVIGVCANENGNCSGTSAKVPVSEVAEVLP